MPSPGRKSAAGGPIFDLRFSLFRFVIFFLKPRAAGRPCNYRLF
jgi:hypothetical protein